MAKYVNQHYFDDIESKRKTYILGAAYAIANIEPDNSVTFRSSKKDLVEIVREELESQHKLQRDKRKNDKSYWIEIDNPVHMRYAMEGRGIVRDKSKRKFPQDIRKEYISHFVRGFFDARAHVYNTDKGSTSIEIMFNRKFLSGLHDIFVKYANVERKKPTGNLLTYRHSDAMKIHNFIYSDWGYTRRNGLYLPSKKRQFNLDYTAPEHALRKKSLEKMEMAKELLPKGFSHQEIADILDYSNVFAFYRAFKNATGMTTSQFLKKKRKLKSGAP